MEKEKEGEEKKEERQVFPRKMGEQGYENSHSNQIFSKQSQNWTLSPVFRHCGQTEGYQGPPRTREHSLILSLVSSFLSFFILFYLFIYFFFWTSAAAC